MLNPTTFQMARNLLEQALLKEEASVEFPSCSPKDLELVFELVLGWLLRTGPDGDFGPQGPNRLLKLAGDAALAGRLPLASVSRLRGILEGLEIELIEKQFWEQESPLWWRPLPNNDLPDFSLKASVDPDLAHGAFHGTDAPQYLFIGSFLSEASLARLFERLESAWVEDGFSMSREGVGDGGRIYEGRADTVRYLTGYEKDVLDRTPELAALVQWAFEGLIGHFSAAFGEREISPPGSCMLARYQGPSLGYHCHLDNPGGANDNGRAFSLVVYLNDQRGDSNGGDLAVWRPGGEVNEPPHETLPAHGAVLFNSRVVAHQVLPLTPGKARWSLVFWFNDSVSQPPIWRPQTPELNTTHVLLPLKNPALCNNRILFHELNDQEPEGRLTLQSEVSPGMSAGIVSTVYGVGLSLVGWCDHHLQLGFRHIILIFDHLEEPAESETAELLRTRYSFDQVTIVSGEALLKGFHQIPCAEFRPHDLMNFAGQGSSLSAICARQTLNATWALQQARSGRFQEFSLDWLVHLDGDEWFCLEGKTRGGSSLSSHFGAAWRAGYRLIRYINHERLLPAKEGERTYKLNPRLAAARLGKRGWKRVAAHIGRSGDGMYFNGYHNGKSAVAVSCGKEAAGVHSWCLQGDAGPTNSVFLAGPCVLHDHFLKPDAFRRKYLAVELSTDSQVRLFEASPCEEAALAILKEADCLDKETLGKRLDQLAERLLFFSEKERTLLAEAGLLLHF